MKTVDINILAKENMTVSNIDFPKETIVINKQLVNRNKMTSYYIGAQATHSIGNLSGVCDKNIYIAPKLDSDYTIIDYVSIFISLYQFFWNRPEYMNYLVELRKSYGVDIKSQTWLRVPEKCHLRELVAAHFSLDLCRLKSHDNEHISFNPENFNIVNMAVNNANCILSESHHSNLTDNLNINNIAIEEFSNQITVSNDVTNLIELANVLNKICSQKDELIVPPFFIDMSKLFELYVLMLLLKGNPEAKILYQFECTNKAHRPDFLMAADSEKFVLDAKYKAKYDIMLASGNAKEDVKNVAIYGICKEVRKVLGLNATSQGLMQPMGIFIFPDKEGRADLHGPLSGICSADSRPEGYEGIYTIKVKLPVLNVSSSNEYPNSNMNCSSKKKGIHINAYEPWTDNEKQQLINECNQKMSIKNIANTHGRTRGAIKSAIRKVLMNQCGMSNDDADRIIKELTGNNKYSTFNFQKQ